MHDSGWRRLLGLLLYTVVVALLAPANASAQPRTPFPWLPEAALEDRSRTGPLYISLARDVGGPFPAVDGYWSREWTGGRRTIETRGARTTEKWLGYRLPNAQVTGDFDVEVEYAVGRDRCEVRTFLRSRLSAGVFDVRHVFRLSPAATPDPAKTYVMFGMDEWVQDPVARLTSARVNRKLPTAPTAFLDEGDGHGLYRNRCSPRPMVSIHTERFGLMVHDLDPDNAAPGSLLVGSNDGALEFGWAYRAPGEHKPGNGLHGARTQIGPTIRFVPLPGRQDVANGWWDSLHVFKDYAKRSGLLNQPLLKDRNVPAEWARDSLSLVVNVGMPVSGDPKHTINPGPAADVIRGMVRFYRSHGQRRFTPMLWAWSAVGPYRAPAGFDELLVRLREMERELDVEIHPAVYMHGCMLSKAAIGTPLEACLMRDLRGKPFTWGGDLYNAHADHPVFVAEMERTVRDMVRRGVRGFYFDAPFGEEMPDYGQDGVLRRHHAAVRRTLLRVQKLLAGLGGGVISHEAQRLGLPGFKGAAAPTVPGSTIVPFTEALYHEREVPIFFGDLAGQMYSLAAADARAGTPGTYHADDDMARMAIEGAVYGRSAVMSYGIDRPYHDMKDSAKWEDRAMYRMAGEAMPNALRFRREHRELLTGRMLPCPKHDTVEHTVRHRPWIYVNTPQGVNVELQPEVLDFRVPLIPAAFYQDTEAAGRYLLVAGNPTRTAQSILFTITRADLPGWRQGLERIMIEGAQVLSRTANALNVRLDIPPTNLACARVIGAR